VDNFVLGTGWLILSNLQEVIIAALINKNNFISSILLKCLGGVDYSSSQKHFSSRKKGSYPQFLWITP
jgi:hypothetical protein